jgi:hypothetical protein
VWFLTVVAGKAAGAAARVVLAALSPTGTRKRTTDSRLADFFETAPVAELVPIQSAIRNRDAAPLFAQVSTYLTVSLDCAIPNSRYHSITFS